MGTYSGDDFEEIDPESRIQEVAQEELFNQAIQFQRKWRNNLRDANWENSGESINDVTVEPPREGSDSYRIGGDVPQLFIAEFGRRPGSSYPPYEPIADWVNEQADMPSRGETETRTDENGNIQTVTFDDVVFLVRRAIAENGIEPIRAARRAWSDMEDLYEDSVEAELGGE